MKWKSTILPFLLSLLLSAPSFAGDPDTINTVPSSNASFLTDLQTFLREEDGDRQASIWQSSGSVALGGTHATGAGLTKAPDTLTAYPSGIRITETGSIVYADDETTWVIACRTTTGNLGTFTRVSGTHYLIDAASASKPALPSNCVWLMQVVTAGGAVTTVTDLRNRIPHVAGEGTFELVADLPAAGVRGRFAFVTATSSYYFDDGTSWRVIPGNLAGARLVLESFAKASLPAAATAGRLARVTDNERGVWMDQGSQWFGLSGEVINCKEFGATGDGTTDDTTALRACIAAAQNGLQPKLVFIPAGSYVISDTLLPSPTTLRTVDITGAGIGTRIINRILGAAQTGTVTVTNGSATVTGSGTSFTADLIGATVRFGSDTEFYVVTGVASTTSLTLLAGGFSGTYRGATLAGVTMRWHKPVFAINDPTSSQTLANGSRIANMWIDNGRDSTHLINNTSNAIELTNAVDTYLDNLILTPFGHGISHRKTTIIFHANNVRIWPSGFVSSVTSANLSDKDGVQFESGGEDVTVYRNLFVTSGRSCVNSGTQGIGSTTQQVIFDAPLCQALYAPVAAELGTATAIGASSLTDTGQTWVVNKYRGALVSITSGTGQGQVRFISSNTATVLTLVTPWDTTTTPIATDGYQIGGGGFISGAAMAGVRIMSPYFEDTPGVGSGGNAWGEVAAYFGNGTSNVLVENTSNATGAYIFASDPALTDTFLNLMLGGQIDRLRIDTGGSRFTCLHARLLVQGGAGSNVVDNGTLSSFINCPRSGGASFTGFQKWGQPVVANNSDYRILDHNGTERPVLAFKGTALSVTTLQGGLTGSVADTATVTIGDKSNFLGAINVINANDEKGCLFFVSTGAVAELSDPDTTCSVTAATASSTNLYFSGSNLIIENRTGAVANYKISMLGG